MFLSRSSCSSLEYVKATRQTSSCLRRVSNDVTQIPNRLDQFRRVISIHFFAQLIDSEIDQIIVHTVVGIPNRTTERVSGDDPTGTLHQEFQQPKLRPAQDNILACTHSVVGSWVQDQIANTQDLWAWGRATWKRLTARGTFSRNCFAHAVRPGRSEC
jgi:hypothetical protein